ncbi:hypothetical protein ACFLYA_02125 [Candidatus Dependentiae bacterium]
MKSIICEASSIAKAIEKSWQKAGKPQSFSVKVLEQEEKNFLGMTRKPAKIALFFDKKTVAPVKRVIKRQPIEKQAKPKRKIVKKIPWSDDMVQESKKWTLDMLRNMKLSHIKFLISPSNNNLRIHFALPLMDNKSKEKELFKNFAFLLMQTLRYRYKRQFRNLKAVFTSE